ncbi:MAG: anti-sigma factor family protein [Blastocatellia bacterium]
MECRVVEDRIWLYAEGDLDPAYRPEMREHFRTCESCRRRLEEAEGSQSWLKTYRPPEFGEQFFDTIRSATFASIGEMKRGRWFVAEAVAQYLVNNWKQLAVCSSVVLFLCLIGPHFRNGRRSPADSVKNALNDRSTDRIEKRANRLGVEKAQTATPKCLVIARHRLVRSRAGRGGRNILPYADNEAALSANSPVDQRPLRIEIQTADPNVRIIWFVPGGREPAPPAEDNDTM